MCNRGEPVPPDAYLVRGVLTLDPPEKLVAEAHELEVSNETSLSPVSSVNTSPPSLLQRELSHRDQGTQLMLATSKSGTHWEPRDQGLDGGLVSSLRALL